MPLTSFYTALTGINSNSTAINVIGDNLANMNTTAFKSSKASFKELLAGQSGTDSAGNPISMGLGSSLGGITRSNTQGTPTSTGVSTDAAINGNGFFIVETEGGGMGFTRNGAFQLDKEGNFLSSDGFKVLGYPIVAGVVDTSSTVSSIVIKKGEVVPAGATSEISILANLDAGVPTGGEFSTSLNVFDSIGLTHAIKLTFTRSSPTVWSWSATIPAEDLGGTAGSPPTEVGSGDLNFDTIGNVVPPATAPTIDIAGLASGAADMAITFNLTDKLGKGLITNYGASSAVSSTVQNGYGASSMADIRIESDGLIVGTTEGGQTIKLAQLALANFPNVDGLAKYSGSTFVAFTSSGEPSIGMAGTGGRGTLVGSALEKSNVDMAQEFINLITAQKAYQASSKIITTTNDLYQESVNLIR